MNSQCVSVEKYWVFKGLMRNATKNLFHEFMVLVPRCDAKLFNTALKEALDACMRCTAEVRARRGDDVLLQLDCDDRASSGRFTLEFGTPGTGWTWRKDQ